MVMHEGLDVTLIAPEVRVARRMRRDRLGQTPIAARTPQPPDGMVRIGGRKLVWGDQTYLILPFFLDRTPVTNAAWRDFVRGAGEIAPAHWIRREPPAGKLDHPVVGVTWEAAQRYATWIGRRLPTHLEWLAAARGPDGAWAFPWGSRCSSMAHCNCPRAQPEGTSPVTAHPRGASPDGCLDLIGNVWEWTAEDRRAPGLAATHAHAFGGSFRGACGATPGTPHATLPRCKEFIHVGLRCAASLEQP